MIGCPIAHARWHSHVNGVNPSRQMRHWLIDDGSLTLKLIARCDQFRVCRLRQAPALCLADELVPVQLRRRIRVQEREVLLQCDGRPVVYAHTIVPLRATAADWPFFGALGERSLGFTLFHDPRVVRGALQFARLRPNHPLVRRAQTALGGGEIRSTLLARRCLYRRRRGMLLVTELFLPAIADLDAATREPRADMMSQLADKRSNQ